MLATPCAGMKCTHNNSNDESKTTEITHPSGNHQTHSLNVSQELLEFLLDHRLDVFGELLDLGRHLAGLLSSTLEKGLELRLVLNGLHFVATLGNDRRVVRDTSTVPG